LWARIVRKGTRPLGPAGPAFRRWGVVLKYEKTVKNMTLTSQTSQTICSASSTTPKWTARLLDEPTISQKDKISVSFVTVPGLSSKYQQSKLGLFCLTGDSAFGK
jgi:hypothetical protein